MVCKLKPRLTDIGAVTGPTLIGPLMSMYSAVTEILPAVILPPNFIDCGLITVAWVGTVPLTL